MPVPDSNYVYGNPNQIRADAWQSSLNSPYVTPMAGPSAPGGKLMPGGNGTAYYVPPPTTNPMPTIQRPLFMPNIAGSGAFGPGGGGAGAPYQYPVMSPTFVPNISPARPVTANGITQTPRSVNQAYGVNDAWNQERSNNAAAQGTLADFTKNYLASKPTATSYNDQESAAIGKFYGTGPGSVTGDLAEIRRKNAQNIFNASQGAIRRATAANSARRMMSGNNSANDHTYAQMLAEIAANTATQQGAQAGNDYRYVADNRNGLAGKRQTLLNNLMMNDLTPLDVNNRYQSNNLATLGTLGNLENANSLYDTSGYDRSRLLNELMP